MATDPTDALEQHFGFRKFLDGQEPVVSAICARQDTLAIMPTGGGKSLCYQLPALILPGVTLVISPLIALMKDQVDALQRRGIAAAMINSTLSFAEQKERIAALRAGEIKLVYIAPERFRSRSFTEALRAVEIAFVAVDEAHCISQWGHDFRPDYQRMGRAMEFLGRPQVAAFTATATPAVRDDIQACLQLRDPFVSVSGFERPNLSLNVTHTEKVKEKFARLRQIISQERTGIIYCSTRKNVEEVYEEVREWKIGRAIAYHGGMDDATREQMQNEFSNRDADIAVATNAFGMGIDRADVRFVAHYDIPGSIEAYYQEAGRAGRDGEPATCELLFNYADTRTQEFFIEGNNPGADLIRSLYALIQHEAGPAGEINLPIRALGDLLGLKNDMGVGSALTHLARLGYVERYDIPGQRARGTRLTQPMLGAEDLQLDERGLAEKESRDRDKLRAIIDFCYAQTCRQAWILRYFGEEEPEDCGSCDACRESGPAANRAPTAEEKVIVQKALSGVARMSARTGSGEWVGRFGRGKIMQMLLGSRSQEVLNARLDELSTYGLLEKFGAPFVNALFEEMLAAGLIKSERDGVFTLLTLTPRGADAMRGKLDFQMRWPEAGGTGSAKSNDRRSASPRSGTKAETPDLAIDELGFDQRLFDRLKAKRLQLANEEGIPAYRIFGNDTLKGFARLKPKTWDEGLRVKGVGEFKAERYLETFLEVIREG